MLSNSVNEFDHFARKPWIWGLAMPRKRRTSPELLKRKCNGQWKQPPMTGLVTCTGLVGQDAALFVQVFGTLLFHREGINDWTDLCYVKSFSTIGMPGHETNAPRFFQLYTCIHYMYRYDIDRYINYISNKIYIYIYYTSFSRNCVATCPLLHAGRQGLVSQPRQLCPRLCPVAMVCLRSVFSVASHASHFRTSIAMAMKVWRTHSRCESLISHNITLDFDWESKKVFEELIAWFLRLFATGDQHYPSW